MLALAFMGVVESVFEDFTPQAEAAAKKKTAKKSSKKAAKKSSKSSGKPATATRAASVISLETAGDLEKAAKKGTVQFFEQYGCYKAILGEAITVSESATVIITEATKAFKAGTTVKTGTKLMKGTAIKVFFKKVVQKTESAKEAAVKTETVETKPETAVRPVIVTNTPYLLEFSTLAEYKGKVVDGSEIQDEDDLSLIAKECFRDSTSNVRFMLRAERDFKVDEENYFVTIYLGNGKVRDMRAGMIVKKGAMVTLTFRHMAAVTRFAAPVADTTPEQVELQPVVASVPESVPETVNEPAEAVEQPGHVATLDQIEDYGEVLQTTPAFSALRLVTEDFSVDPELTVHIRARDGHWIDVEPDENGKVTIKAGTQSVYIFKNVRKVASKP